MTRLICIDPGVHECAVAVYTSTGRLYDCGFVTLSESLGAEVLAWLSPEPVTIVCEKPQFDRRVSKHVIDLAWSGARVAESFARGGPVTAVTPSEWKGSTPKPQHHAEALAALSPAELAVLPPDTAARVSEACREGGLDAWRKPGASYYGKAKGAEVHNILDAVALGLWRLGRLAGPVASVRSRARTEARALVRAGNILAKRRSKRA